MVTKPQDYVWVQRTVFRGELALGQPNDAPVFRSSECAMLTAMGKQQIIEKHLRQATNQAYWIGAALGLVFGIILGLAIDYNLGSDEVTIITMDQGQKI